MLHHLEQITPSNIKRYYDGNPPDRIVPLHNDRPTQINYTPICFLFNSPYIKQLIFDKEPGLVMLYENCVAKEPDLPEPVRRHLSDNTVPYLLLMFLTKPADLAMFIQSTIPGHLRINPAFIHHITNFSILFIEGLYQLLYSNYFSFASVFLSIRNFYVSLYDFMNTKTEIIYMNLSKRLGYIPSYLSPIQKKRLLIYTHLDPGTLRECNNILKKDCHPMIILHETSPQNQFLRPSEWKLLTTFLPSYLSPNAQACVDNFTALLYPQDNLNNIFEFHQIPPGGGCGWSVPGINQCLIQFLTFMQPNWMELWTDMRWNISIEMLKRLFWLNDNLHLLIIDPIDILAIFFSPD
jgi:hypothetical protein